MKAPPIGSEMGEKSWKNLTRFFWGKSASIYSQIFKEVAG
jgi:hypothetical protein